MRLTPGGGAGVGVGEGFGEGEGREGDWKQVDRICKLLIVKNLRNLNYEMTQVIDLQ